MKYIFLLLTLNCMAESPITKKQFLVGRTLVKTYFCEVRDIYSLGVKGKFDVVLTRDNDTKELLWSKIVAGYYVYSFQFDKANGCNGSWE